MSDVLLSDLGHLARYQLGRATSRVTALGPAWWSAIAGAVAAGAVIAPGHRVLGGLGGGVAMLVIAAVVPPVAAPAPCNCAGTSSPPPAGAATLADLSGGGCA